MSNKKHLKQEESVTEDSTKWTTEDTNNLLSRMLCNLSKPDTMKYTSMLDKLAWDKVKFGNFSADDCKLKWTTLSREVRKYRTLTELVIDAKEYLRDPYKGQIKKHPDYPKRPLTPYFRFFMEKRDTFAEKHKDMTNLEVTAELSKRYRALAAKKKEKYLEEWKKETINFQTAMKKFKEDHPDYFAVGPTKPPEPHTPMIVYKEEFYEEYARKHPNLSKKECCEALKKKYKSLPDDRKQKYIEKALKEQQDYKVAMEKYLESNPTVAKKSSRTVLNKYERKLNDKSIGKPDKPPSNGYNLFCTETMSTLKSMLSQNRIIECGRLWNLKSAEEKQHYHIRYLKLKEQYNENYKKFLNSLTPDERKQEKEQSQPKKRQATNSNTTGKLIKLEAKDSSSEDSSDDEYENISDHLNDTSDDDEDEDDDSDSGNDEEDDNENEEDVIDEDAKEENDIKSKVLLPGLAPVRPTTPISALFLYQKAHRKKVESQYPRMSSDEITRLLARRYHELPEHRRHKYAQREKQQRALYNEKMQQYLKTGTKKNGTETKNDPPVQPQPVTGEQLYHEKCASFYQKKFKTQAEVEAALRTSWSKFSKVRKQPYIKAAQELNEKNIAAYRVAMEKNNFVVHDSVSEEYSTEGKSKTMSARKVKLDGEPKKPPPNGYQLFSATYLSKLSHLSQNEKFKEIGRMWKKLDPAKKQAFANEAKKSNDKYKRELEIWLKQLPPDVVKQYIEQQSKKRIKKVRGDAESSPSDKKIKLTKAEEDQETKNVDHSSSSESAADSDSSSSEDESDDEDSSSSSSDSDGDVSSGSSSSEDMSSSSQSD
ncbi:nucleolar transcription factor 1-like [Clavelina lepadiformis]|uniref:nucleolar transcription factor 1-like n=1 Tax=Clavelina lepadiformis TaxID=159417 RepID=UPI0040431587